MKSRAWLWPVLGVLIAALAWWVLDQGSAADPLDTNEPSAVEGPPPNEAIVADERERTEAQPAAVELGHGHEPAEFDFGALLSSVKQQVWKEAKRTFRFSGRVLSEGVPVAGAEVIAREARRWGDPDPEAAEVLLTCNSAGEFFGELAVRESYDLELLPRSYRMLPKDSMRVAQDVKEDVNGLELVLFPATEFYGAVTIENGLVVEGAKVKLTIHDHWQRRREGAVRNTTYVPIEYPERETRVDGQFAFEVPEGEFQIDASHAEYGNASLWKASPEDSPHDLRLKVREKDPTSRIVGRVHGPDGRPMPGAKLIFSPNGPKTDADENGEFVLDGAKKHWATEPELFAWAPGMTPATAALGELIEFVGPVRIDLQPGAVIAGHVVDADGDGVRGMQLRILGLRELQVGDTSAPTVLSKFGTGLDRANSASDGSFRFDALPIGQYTLVAGDQVFDPKASAVVTTGQEDVELVIGQLTAPGANISGTVVRGGDGAPLAGVKIEANRIQRTGTNGWSAGSVRSVTTNENGEYLFSELIPGEYYFEAVLQDYARGKSLPEVEKIGQKRLDFTLYQERTVRISVINQAGDPVPGAAVTIRDPSGQALMISSGDGTARTPGRTDDAGKLLAHRMPGGPVTVEIEAGRADKVTREFNWSADIEHIVEITIDA
jgi:Carboxypeptidase regulatory-like domain